MPRILANIVNGNGAMDYGVVASQEAAVLHKNLARPEQFF